jgi:hypothetical protein
LLNTLKTLALSTENKNALQSHSQSSLAETLMLMKPPKRRLFLARTRVTVFGRPLQQEWKLAAEKFWGFALKRILAVRRFRLWESSRSSRV